MFKEKNIVIYKNNIAIITQIDDKYTIKYQSIKATATKPAQYATIKVREKDITFLHPGICELSILIDNANNNLIIDSITNKILETYELFISDPSTENEEISIQDLAELACGEYEAENCWCFYLLLVNLPYFSQTDKLTTFVPRNKTEIDAINKKNQEKQNETLLHDEFISRLKSKKLLPSDSKYMQEVEAFCLGKTDKSKLLKEIGISETIEKAHQLLLDTGIWSITYNPYPFRYGLTTQSAQEILEQPPQEERLQIDHIAYAIDNEGSTDPDDAVGYDGKSIWVHIADPASTVLPNTPIDISARKRGSTLYIPECTSRMLNEQCFTSYALGLTEFSKALSFQITLDDDANIIDTKIHKTIVKVKRLTYQQADELQNEDYLKPLFSIAQKYNKKRNDNGAINIELPEVNISVSKDADKKVSIISNPKTKSAAMIKEMMLMAGEGVARFAFKNQIPFPFISQDEPDIPKDLPDGLALQYKLRRCMRSRSLGITPSMHCSLGLGMYCQVTSPLRRYIDLIAHQQLRAFLDNKPLISKEDLLERISTSDAGISAGIKAERASNLHWKLVYLLQNPTWQGKATVVEIKGKYITLLIPELALETSMVNQKNLKLNDEITVTAGNISIPELTVTFKEN